MEVGGDPAPTDEPPTTEFVYLDGGSVFDDWFRVLEDPITWLILGVALLLAALATAALCKLSARLTPLKLILLGGAAPLVMLLLLIIHAAVFVRQDGFSGILEILLEKQMSFAASLIYIAGIIGARLTVGLLGRGRKSSPAAVFD